MLIAAFITFQFFSAFDAHHFLFQFCYSLIRLSVLLRAVYLAAWLPCSHLFQRVKFFLSYRKSVAVGLLRREVYRATVHIAYMGAVGGDAFQNTIRYGAIICCCSCSLLNSTAAAATHNHLGECTSTTNCTHAACAVGAH